MITVKINDIVSELEIRSESHPSHLNRETGEIVTIPEEYFPVAESGEDFSAYSDWEKELIEAAADVLASDSYVPLPSEFDIHEYWSSCPSGKKPSPGWTPCGSSTRSLPPMAISQLNGFGVKFITLRRRGKRLIESADSPGPWKRGHIAHVKRKYQNPQVHESIPRSTSM